MAEPRRTNPPIAALFILLFVALVLALVSLIRTVSVSPIQPWMAAMYEGDYAEAALILTDGRSVEDWLVQTESLALQHGEIAGLQRSDNILLPPGEGVISTLTVNWADGYARCLLLHHGEDGSLGIVGGYFDCDTLSERVPEGGQLLPEERPDGPGAPFAPGPAGPPDTPPSAAPDLSPNPEVPPEP